MLILINTTGRHQSDDEISSSSPMTT